jgi:hypothetical protein
MNTTNPDIHKALSAVLDNWESFFEIWLERDVVERTQEVIDVSLAKDFWSDLHAFQLLDEPVDDRNVLLVVETLSFKKAAEED